jgi:hypothetical protein
LYGKNPDMPPADPETAVRVVIEGIFMKLGDIILVKSAKGAVLIAVMMRRQLNRKPGGSKRDHLPHGRKNKRD